MTSKVGRAFGGEVAVLTIGLALAVGTGCESDVGDLGQVQAATTGEPEESSSTPLETAAPVSFDRIQALDSAYRSSAVAPPVAPGAASDPPQLGFQFSRRGVVRAINGPGMAIPVTGVVVGTTRPDDAARTFLGEWADLFGLRDPARELQFLRTTTNAAGEEFVRFDQRTASGRPVFAHGMIVTLNRDLRVAGVSGLLLADPPDGTPRVPAVEAQDAATRALGRPYRQVSTPTLGAFDPEVFGDRPGAARMAWQVDVETDEPGIWRYYVDAETAAVLLVFDVLARDQKRDVYWLDHALDPSAGTLIWRYNPPYDYGSRPGTSQQILDANTAAWNYYSGRHARDGWDNGQCGVAGCPCTDPTCHRLRTKSDQGAVGGSNAWWSETYCMAYFQDRAACNDVVGHEVTHGVDWVEANLKSNRVGQTGSLSESFPDIFGEFIERYAGGVPDWRQGTGGTCFPVRNIENPENPGPGCGSCPVQPAHFLNYNRNGDDIYRNMGIPNKAGWLLGREPGLGAVTFAGITVTGIGESDASRVWYDTLANRLSESSNFRVFRNAIISAAASLFGVGDNKYVQALRSVDAVGIWSSDYWLSFDSDRRVALARFTVSGESRRYLLYKEVAGTDPDLYARYTTSCIYCGGGWSAATHVDYTGAGPGAAVFDSKLWVFFKYDLNSNLYYRTLDSSGTWSARTAPTGSLTTDNDVAAVVFNGKLHVFYKVVGTGARSLKYNTWTPASGWLGPYDTGATSETGPAVAATLGDKLWLVYLRDTTAGNLRYRTLTTGGVWSDEVTPPRQHSAALVGSPAAYVYLNRLHVAGRSAANDLVFSGYCPSGAGCYYRIDDWSQSVVLDMGGRASPCLWDEGLNNLYMFYRSTGSNALWWNYKRSE